MAIDNHAAMGRNLHDPQMTGLRLIMEKAFIEDL
jgi:hypothetical protein